MRSALIVLILLAIVGCSNSVSLRSSTDILCESEIVKPIHRSHTEALSLRHGYELLFYWHVDSLVSSTIDDLVRSDISIKDLEKYDCEALEYVIDNVNRLYTVVNSPLILDLYQQQMPSREDVIKSYILNDRGEDIKTLRLFTMVSLLDSTQYSELKEWVDRNYLIVNESPSQFLY